MGSGQAHRAAEQAAPHLQPGEPVIATAFGTMGTIDIGKSVALAVVVGIVSLGTVMAWQRPRKAYYALTSQRLMAFDGETMLGKPGKLLWILPLKSAQVARSRKGVIGVLRVDLAIAGQPKGLRLNFAPGSREAGEKVVAAIAGGGGGGRVAEAIAAAPLSPQPAYGSPQPAYASARSAYESPRQPAYGAQAQPEPVATRTPFEDPWQAWDQKPQPPARPQPPQSPAHHQASQPQQGWGNLPQPPWERNRPPWEQESQPLQDHPHSSQRSDAGETTQEWTAPW